MKSSKLLLLVASIFFISCTNSDTKGYSPELKNKIVDLTLYSASQLEKMGTITYNVKFIPIYDLKGELVSPKDFRSLINAKKVKQQLYFDESGMVKALVMMPLTLEELKYNAPKEDEFIKLESVMEGQPVPNGSFLSIDDGTVAIESFRGKYIIIDFWATWCAPCLEEAPIFKQLAEKHAADNVEFITISVDQDFTGWKGFLKDKNWIGNHYWLGQKEGNPFYSLTYSKHIIENSPVILVTLPKYVIISPEGEILSNAQLRPSDPLFEEALQKYLN
ncbi:hypothetical protein SB49_01330 [Sediminicola sp. YIK13]|uniref:TlpA family protein disulfide reductase n=1 Tax=Sediminicola sp. YIK13 TaxID=1453352 RepID=UPI0007228236|nr:TlpA disulfide reductase family protein [Sediminicola sp. YIK13]ALM06604.1 hypothetical protein SB49_01330 [Sediminicola sp. YIK13]